MQLTQNGIRIFSVLCFVVCDENVLNFQPVQFNVPKNKMKINIFLTVHVLAILKLLIKNSPKRVGDRKFVYSFPIRKTLYFVQIIFEILELKIFFLRFN